MGKARKDLGKLARRAAHQIKGTQPAQKSELRRDASSFMADALPSEPWSSPAAKVLSPSTSKGPVPMTKNKIIEKKRSSKISSIVSAAGLVLSRGQRKRMAKKTNIVRRKEIGELVTAKQIKFEHGTLGEMDEIRLALPTAAPESKRGPGKQTKKKLQRTLIAETAQLRAVLTHPLFQASPISTIHDHLENSIKLSKVNS